MSADRIAALREALTNISNEPCRPEKIVRDGQPLLFTTADGGLAPHWSHLRCPACYAKCTLARDNTAALAVPAKDTLNPKDEA